MRLTSNGVAYFLEDPTEHGGIEVIYLWSHLTQQRHHVDGTKGNTTVRKLGNNERVRGRQ